MKDNQISANAVKQAIREWVNSDMSLDDDFVRDELNKRESNQIDAVKYSVANQYIDNEGRPTYNFEKRILSSEMPFPDVQIMFPFGQSVDELAKAVDCVIAGLRAKEEREMDEQIAEFRKSNPYDHFERPDD